MPVPNDDWLLQKLIEENGTALRSVWDLYLKFYTAFLTFSVLALGLTVQYIHKENRLPVVLAFIFQNIFSAGTAIGMARYSRWASTRFDHLCQHFIMRSGYSAEQADLLRELADSPTPGWLGVYGGVANFFSHVTLIGCWLAALWV